MKHLANRNAIPKDDWLDSYPEFRIRCDRRWHRLEVVSSDQGGETLRFHHHDQQIDEVMEVLGQKESKCSIFLRRFAGLTPLVEDPKDRVAWALLAFEGRDCFRAWAKVGVTTPEGARQWMLAAWNDRRSYRNHGVIAGEVADWQKRGFSTPEEVAPWVEAGMDPGNAQAWQSRGVSPAEVAAWARRGVGTTGELDAWRELGIRQVEDLQAWHDLGVGSSGAGHDWASLGARNPEEIGRWLAAGGGDRDTVRKWQQAGLVTAHGQGPDQLAGWIATGIDWSEAWAWLRAGRQLPGGLRFQDRERWLEQGVLRSDEYERWISVGATHPDDLVRWHEAGVGTSSDARQWGAVGVRSLWHLQRWHALGVDFPEEALAWIGSRMFTGVEEVAEWIKAGIDSAEEARHILVEDRSRIPDRVLELRRESHWKIRLNGGPGEVLVPPRDGADPRAVVTERYFYAYSQRCIPEVATYVIEQDFDEDGREVSRAERDLESAKSQRSH